MKPSDSPGDADVQASLRNVLTALSDFAGDEQRAAFEAVREQPLMQAASEALQEGDPQAYFYAFRYPFEQIEQGLLRSYSPDAKVGFVFEQYRFIKAHLRTLFETYEGSSCCADKARAVINAWLRFLHTGKPIVWNRQQQYTFHLPGTVLTTHESIQAFFEALTRLYHGRPDLYLAFMQELGPAPAPSL